MKLKMEITNQKAENDLKLAESAARLKAVTDMFTDLVLSEKELRAEIATLKLRWNLLRSYEARNSAPVENQQSSDASLDLPDELTDKR